MEFIDQLNRKVHFPKPPLRIVSLVPSQTELLVDLGLRKNIVGITKFCVHPVDLRKEIRIVGGTKKVNLSKIESLRPDIIICNKEENTEEMVFQLEAIAPVWVSDIYTIEDNNNMILKLGEIFKTSQRAIEIVAAIEKKVADFTKFSQSLPSIKVLYLIWKNPYMGAGRATFINSLLHLNNFENSISEEFSRYPKVDPGLFMDTNIIFLSTEPYPFNEKNILDLHAKTGVAVKLVDGEYFSWYGSRLLKAFDYFKTLHPFREKLID